MMCQRGKRSIFLDFVQTPMDGPNASLTYCILYCYSVIIPSSARNADNYNALPDEVFDIFYNRSCDVVDRSHMQCYSPKVYF